ncbi:hypothetical protein [Clostridium scatologenes]|uniref:Histidine kinase n=1 Tax=Clostridium scatologenes TaxID=1548 RepID=A0A0E3JWR5_CLOSL|nr:hypothetical protein [Clostridium scatologenes]AKA67443.1 histidine kinase [Clostridium scatologenes]
MKFYKSIIFKLFIILSSILISFLCIIVFIQVFIVGRTYNISQNTIERERHIELFTDEFISKIIFNNEGINYKFTAFEKIQLSSLEKFENQNLINFIVFDKDLNNVKITQNTKSQFDPYYVDYIRNKIINYNFSIHYFPDTGDKMPLFRIYNKYKIPTKYIVLEEIYKVSKSDYIYVAAIIPEVFTSTSSNILKKYANLYMFIFNYFNFYCFHNSCILGGNAYIENKQNCI